MTTTDQKNANPLVNCLQQELYEGKTGDAATGGSIEMGPKKSGWWAFQYDPADPTQITMLVTLEAASDRSGADVSGDDGCLSYYSSRLSVAEVQSLYQWLALQMGQQMSAAGKKTKSKDDSPKI